MFSLLSNPIRIQWQLLRFTASWYFYLPAVFIITVIYSHMGLNLPQNKLPEYTLFNFYRVDSWLK